MFEIVIYILRYVTVINMRIYMSKFKLSNCFHFKFLFLICVCTYACMCVCMCTMCVKVPRRPEEGFRSPGRRVIDNCESPGIGVEIETPVLWKKSKEC